MHEAVAVQEGVVVDVAFAGDEAVAVDETFEAAAVLAVGVGWTTEARCPARPTGHATSAAAADGLARRTPSATSPKACSTIANSAGSSCRRTSASTSRRPAAI